MDAGMSQIGDEVEAEVVVQALRDLLILGLFMPTKSEVIWPVVVRRQEIWLEPLPPMLQASSNPCKEAQGLDGEALGERGSVGSISSRMKDGYMCPWIHRLSLGQNIWKRC